MSVQEMPYSVSARPLDFLRKKTKVIEKLRSDLNKLHEKNKFMYNYMVNQLQNFKLHIKPQAVPDNFQGIALVFRKTTYEQDQMMHNSILVKLQNFKLQMQYMVNMLHDRNLLHLNKVHEGNQMMLQNVKLQM